MQSIQYDGLPGGRPMRGVASRAGPEKEMVAIRHEMPGGTFATEYVIRAVEPLEPFPSTPPEASTDAEAP